MNLSQYFFLCIAIFLLHDQCTASAFSLGINRRDDDSEYAGILSIPLTIESSSGRYLANVNMSSGASLQSFLFGVTTSTAYTMVAGSACDSCSSVPTYNRTASVTAQNWTDPAGTPSNPFDAPLVKETCSLRQSNGSIWTYSNQTIAVLNRTNPVFANGVSGLLGLGTGVQKGTFADSIIGTYLSTDAEESNFVFGMAIESQKGADGGELHLAQPNPDYYVGTVAWKTVQGSAPDVGTNPVQPGSQPAVTGEWLVQFDGWGFMSGTNTIYNTGGSTLSVDPYFQGIYVPHSQALQIYTAVNNSILQTTSNSNGTQQWAVPCDAQMTFNVQIGSETFSLNQSLLVTKPNPACYGVIQGWSDPTNSQYLLGSSFLSTVYAIFNASTPGSGSSSSIGFAARAPDAGAEKSSTNIAAIVGGTVGGVVFLALLGLLGWFCFRRRRARQKTRGIATVISPTEPFEKAPSGVVINGRDSPITTAQQQQQPRYRDSYRNSSYRDSSYSKVGSAYAPSPPSSPTDSHPPSLHPSSPPIIGVERYRTSAYGSVIDPSYSVEPFVPPTSSAQGSRSLYPISQATQPVL
ncbi:hypothetical protein JAAARDRAFT_38077 [Jaapia argillacea MUCL 33604]|uniref:Peptidase A1 domain-containing protein n=1 Tax=Jaapia argillacea MUCL 33604 TaxID=933084 RepID=A0A067PUM3_9AGAM|nr:hypothetical protein JAAARDRAFT_38077 [Jaapia argillacea MUCL 33604]